MNPLPQHRHAPRHEAGSVHQVAEYQPVPDADDPAWPEQERPVVDRDERPADGDERARAACASDVLPQRHDRKEADGADGDEGAFNDTGGDIAEGEVLVLPCEDRKQLFLGELIWILFRWRIDGGRLEPVPRLRQRSRHFDATTVRPCYRRIDLRTHGP